MKIKIKLICSVIIALAVFIILNSKVYGASFSSSVSGQSVTVGDTVTVTVTANDAVGLGTVTSSSSSVLALSSSSSNFALDNGSMTVSFTAKAAGTANLVVNVSEFLDQDGNDASASNNSFAITVKAATSSDSSSGSGNSSNSGSDSTTTTPAPTFTSKTETVYATTNVTIRSSYSASSSALGTLTKDSSITRTATSTNGWSKVTYKGSTAYISSTYLTTTKPTVVETETTTTQTETTTTDTQEEDDEEKVSKATVNSIDITGITLDFSSKVYEYTVLVGSSVESLDISAVVDNGEYEITGNSDFVIGTNVVTITITGDDGSETIYTINVNKTEIESEEVFVFGLSTLEIAGVTLLPEFTTDNFEYTFTLENFDLETLIEITALANIEGASVEVLADEYFVLGLNSITILVMSEEGDIATYQLNITCVEVAEEISFFKENQKYFMIGGVLVLLIILITILIIVIKKGRDDEYEDEEDDELENNSNSYQNNPYQKEEKVSVESKEKEIFSEYSNSTSTKQNILNNLYDNDVEEKKVTSKGKHF